MGTASNGPSAADIRAMSTDTRLLSTDNRPLSTDNRLLSTDNRLMSTDRSLESLAASPLSADQGANEAASVPLPGENGRRYESDLEG
jgi:hypothetical protein